MNPRKPDNQKILEGSFRKDRKAKEIEFEDALDVIPVAPVHMAPAARAIWKKIVPTLVLRKVLTSADYEALEVLCNNIWIYRECVKEIRKEGIGKYLRTHNSQTALPMTVMNKAAGIIRTYAGLFGLTPSDRARLNMGAGGKDQDPDEAEMKRLTSGK
jgi:P27 family predicted phage terminase small subunit